MVLLNRCTITLHVASTIFLFVVFDQIDAMLEENPRLCNGTIVNLTISTIGSNRKLNTTNGLLAASGWFFCLWQSMGVICNHR